MALKHKLRLALAAYAVLAVLAWQTLTEPKLQAFVWVVLGFLAFKSVLYWYKETYSAGDHPAPRARNSSEGRE